MTIEQLTKWSAIAVLCIADVIWAHVLGIRLNLIVLPILVVTGAIAYVYSYLRPNYLIASLALSFTEIVAVLLATGVLTYLCFTTNPKVYDAALSRIDMAMGFDWLVWMRWLDQQPILKPLLSFCYWSINYQMILAPFLLATRPNKLREYSYLIVVTLFICGTLSVFLPAESAWAYYKVESEVDAYHLPVLVELRSGKTKEILIGGTHGIITFPSFHVALALISIWVCRQIPWLFPITLVLNVGMILATPIIGGHHLIDVLVGLSITMTVIATRASGAGRALVQYLRFRWKYFV